MQEATTQTGYPEFVADPAAMASFPTVLDYMGCVEWAASNGLTVEEADKILEDHGMIVERVDGEIIFCGENWPAMHALHKAIHERGVQTATAKTPAPPLVPSWEQSEHRQALEVILGIAKEGGLSENQFLHCYKQCQVDENMTVKNIESFKTCIEGLIIIKREHEFAAKFGFSYPADQVIAPGNINSLRIAFETHGELPEAIQVDGITYPRLDLDILPTLAEEELDKPDLVVEVKQEDLQDVIFPDLLDEARAAFDYLTLEKGFTGDNHRLTADAIESALTIGALTLDDCAELIDLAKEHGWNGEQPELDSASVGSGSAATTGDAPGRQVPAIVEVDEERGIAITEDGEILRLCEMLGFTPEAYCRIQSVQQAERVMEKIRWVQVATLDLIDQMKSMVLRNAGALKRGMELYGADLREWGAPQLPRYENDSKPGAKKQYKAGDLKKKFIPTLVGDLVFRGVGGWTVSRPHELNRHLEIQLEDLTEKVRALVDEEVAKLPEELQAIVKIDWKISASKKVAVKVATEMDRGLPGMDYIPKHDTNKVFIGAKGRPWTMTHHVKELNAALKKLKDACAAEDDDDEDSIFSM